MWRWMLRTSGVLLVSTFFLTSPAFADPDFSVHFGLPGVYVGVGHPEYGYYPGYPYYPGYVYPRYGYYPGYAYPGYAYPRYGYVWRGDDGYRRYYGDRTYWGGGRYYRYGRAGWNHGYRGWHGGHWHR